MSLVQTTSPKCPSTLPDGAPVAGPVDGHGAPRTGLRRKSPEAVTVQGQGGTCAGDALCREVPPRALSSRTMPVGSCGPWGAVAAWRATGRVQRATRCPQALLFWAHIAVQCGGVEPRGGELEQVDGDNRGLEGEVSRTLIAVSGCAAGAWRTSATTAPYASASPSRLTTSTVRTPLPVSTSKTSPLRMVTGRRLHPRGQGVRQPPACVRRQGSSAGVPP